MAKGTVTGDKEILQNMRRISKAIGGGQMDKIIRDSLEPMRDRTEQNARKLRQEGYNPPGGHLDQGVVVAKRDQRGSLYRVYWVSFKNRAKKLAHLVEFGTAPHWQPRRMIMHPGARAKPFFRPAFEATKEEVVDDVGKAVWQRILASMTGIRK